MLFKVWLTSWLSVLEKVRLSYITDLTRVLLVAIFAGKQTIVNLFTWSPKLFLLVASVIPNYLTQLCIMLKMLHSIRKAIISPGQGTYIEPLVSVQFTSCVQRVTFFEAAQSGMRKSGPGLFDYTVIREGVTNDRLQVLLLILNEFKWIN